MLDLVIKNGTVINADHSNKLDVGIKDGKIVLLGNCAFFPETSRVVDAAGQYVMPGMIDSHVHINGNTANDSFYHVSKAAAFGGTTTIVEMAIPQNGESPLQAIERRLGEARECVIDYSFHACIKPGNEQLYHEVSDILTGGISSIKMFTVYRNRVMVDMGIIHEVFKILNHCGGLAVIHAESAEIIEFQIDKLVAEGKTTPPFHAISRPPISEVQAIASILPFIQEYGVPTLFVHLAAPQAKDYLQLYRPALPLFTEVCTHYLTLTDEVYQRTDGENYLCCPPIRPKAVQDGLWTLVQEGLIDVVNSDHVGYTTEQKVKHKFNFTNGPNGIPGIETRGIVLFSEGVAKGKISVNQFVALTSANPAKILGMYPQKGQIAVGSDADIVVFDPFEKYTISAKTLQPVSDYTPFEGLEVTGQPVHTIVAGNLVIEDGNAVPGLFRGNFIKRKQPMFK